MRVRSRCDVPSEPTSISGMSALHGLAGQGWVTDTPRMNPVQWRGMPSTCRAVPAANVDRRSRDGQPFRRTLRNGILEYMVLAPLGCGAEGTKLFTGVEGM